MSEILRHCLDCGLKAHNEVDLGNFVKRKEMRYGRRNLCSNCHNKRENNRLATNDRALLTNRFNAMRHRCYDQYHKWYSRYGGRGITIYPEWLESKENFIDWALSNGFERGLHLDRIDNNGNYEPDNCRFTTIEENSRNKSNSKTDWENETRICEMCQEEKPFDAFYNNKTKSGGKTYVCKDCTDESKRKQKERKKNQ